MKLQVESAREFGVFKALLPFLSFKLEMYSQSLMNSLHLLPGQSEE
jgi:hypothetical protein